MEVGSSRGEYIDHESEAPWIVLVFLQNRKEHGAFPSAHTMERAGEDTGKKTPTIALPCWHPDVIILVSNCEESMCVVYDAS